MTIRIEQVLSPEDYGAVSSAVDTTGELSYVGQLRLRLRSDEELMDCLQSGEVHALAVLFHRHCGLVFRIAHRILRNEAEAEDAVQQIFLDIFRASEQFKAAKGSFRTWLLMFTYHRTFNKRRQLQSSRFYDTEEIEEVLPEILAGAGRAFPLSPAETAVLVRESLAMLKPRQRRTIEMVYYEGLTAEEIATHTGETVRVVRHNLYRGLEKMRAVLCGSSVSRQR